MKKITGGVTAAKGFEAAARPQGSNMKQNRYGTCIQRKTVQSGRNFYDQCSKGGSGEVGPPDCGI